MQQPSMLEALTSPRASPAALAEHCSRGRWRRFKHLAYLNKFLLMAAFGHIRRLMIMMPPRHGKSELTSKWFPAWYLGTFPHRQIILASYADEFAAKWGRKTRDILEEFGPSIFGITVRQDSHAANRWGIGGTDGGMITAGAGGQITGHGGDLFLIDDPIKNEEEANSEVIREKHWDWYQSTVLTRLQKNAGLILTMTRWHEQDLAGKILEDMKHGGEKFTVVRLPAIAEEDEHFDGWDRRPGQSLCEDLIPLDNLVPRQRYERVWATMYQQRPYPPSGDFFNVDKIQRVQKRPDPLQIVRSWDFAATEKKDSKRTAGVRLSRAHDQRFYVEHIVMGKWSPDRRNAKVRLTAESDGHDIPILHEEEPGSAGVDQALATARLLIGFIVESIKVTGDKVTRADQVASQINAGNFSLVDDGSWDVDSFLNELRAFPNGEYKDQVDALANGFNWMVAGGDPDFWRAPQGGKTTQQMRDAGYNVEPDAPEDPMKGFMSPG